MIKALKRLQLQRRGLATARKRRKQDESELRQALRASPLVKAFIFIGFYLGLVVLINTASTSAPGAIEPIFGPDVLKASVIGFFIFAAAFIQFFANHPISFFQNGRTLLMFGLILVQLSAVVLCGKIVNVVPYIREEGLQATFLFLLIPYTLAPMALSVLLGRRQAIFGAIFSGIFGCLIVPAGVLFEYLLASFLCGLVAVYTTHELRKRSRLMRAGCYVGLFGLVLALTLGRISILDLTNPSELNGRLIGIQVLTVLLAGVITAGIVGGFLPLLETAFGVTTNITWLELADLNHPLLKRMTLEAPGTYHHSLMVARLSEAAAERVGANPIECQVCSYFHDIGKLVKPGYFIENIGSGPNPHDDLSPNMSALVVMAHVKEGVDLALKYKLKSQIIDVIREHHGNTIVYYFYRRALAKQDEVKKLVQQGKAHEEDIPEVDVESFRYPGSIPQTKESAIISLADAVESASRCLEKPNPSKIEQLVNDITEARVKDGQLDDADLTLRELALVKESFTKTLRSVLHSRIAYPKSGDATGGSDSPPDPTTGPHKDRAPTRRLQVIDAA